MLRSPGDGSPAVDGKSSDERALGEGMKTSDRRDVFELPSGPGLHVLNWNGALCLCSRWGSPRAARPEEEAPGLRLRPGAFLQEFAVVARSESGGGVISARCHAAAGYFSAFDLRSQRRLILRKLSNGG